MTTAISTNFLWDFSRDKLNLSLDRYILTVFFRHLCTFFLWNLDCLLFRNLLTVLLWYLGALLVRNLHLHLLAVLLGHALTVLLRLLLCYLSAALLWYLGTLGCTVAVIRRF